MCVAENPVIDVAFLDKNFEVNDKSRRQAVVIISRVFSDDGAVVGYYHFVRSSGFAKRVFEPSEAFVMSAGIVSGKEQVVTKDDASAVVHPHLDRSKRIIADAAPQRGEKDFGVAQSYAAVVDVGAVSA